MTGQCRISACATTCFQAYGKVIATFDILTGFFAHGDVVITDRTKCCAFMADILTSILTKGDIFATTDKLTSVVTCRHVGKDAAFCQLSIRDTINSSVILIVIDIQARRIA